MAAKAKKKDAIAVEVAPMMGDPERERKYRAEDALRELAGRDRLGAQRGQVHAHRRPPDDEHLRPDQGPAGRGGYRPVRDHPAGGQEGEVT